MSAQLLTTAPPEKPGFRDAFRVVIVYEDYLAGRRAMAACQRLLTRFGHESDFNIIAWSFEVLQCARPNQEAVHDAVDADLIIFTTHSCEELPVEIQQWIEVWIPQKRGQADALVVVLGAGRPAPLHVCNYLRSAAAAAGTGFLAHEVQPTKHPASLSAESNQPTDQMAFEGYGLNE